MQQVELRRVGAVNAPVGSRRELVANTHRRRRTDSIPQLRRVDVGAVLGFSRSFGASLPHNVHTATQKCSVSAENYLN